MLSKTGIFGAFIGAALLLVAGATPSSAYVLGPTTPGKWGSATVTWSLMGNGIANTLEGNTVNALSSFMPIGFETQIANAFSAWAAIADISFLQVPDLGEAVNATQQSGDIRLGGHVLDGAGGVLAHGFFPPLNGTSVAGDIHFDSGDTWKTGFGGPGFNIFTVAAHEIGHAIGLDHTLVAASLMNPFYNEAVRGPQADDIAGVQFIYGAPVSVVPLPAALPLFGSAIAIMGFAGWRRKKRAAA